MKNQAQLQESIERFQSSFWKKNCGDRPPIGIVCDGSFLPINYLRMKFSGKEIFPDDVNAELCMTDYEYISLSRRVFSDDFSPFSAAWRAIPWLEAMCGCPVRYSTGSLAPGHFVDSVDDLLTLEIPAGKEWLECMKLQTRNLTASVPNDCWISPSILRGPSDVIAAMRGLTNFYCDLYDNIRIVDEMASLVNSLLIDILEIHFSMVSPHLEGYGHIFGYWAPGRTIVIQEDVLGMCSPKVYNDVFMKYNTDIIRNLGPYVLFHFHSTGYQHYREVLEMPGIAGIQITIEANGPDLIDMITVLKEILERTRLIIHVDHFFEQLPEVLRHIPHEGLYLLISDKFIQSEDEFRGFIKSNWRV